MFNELFEHVQNAITSTRLDEVLSQAEVARLQAKIASPDIRPGAFDVTLEAWLKRISLWGKLDILHNDPEFKKKEKISQSQMIKRVTDDQLIRMLGQWDIDRKDINVVELFREYAGVDGKKKRESFLITIDLKPEIKKALN